MFLDPYVLGAGALLLASLLASRVSARVGVPSLLLFLVFGMLMGSDGPGGVPFDDPLQAQALGTVALILIMFQGGLQTHWRHVRPVVLPALSLATIGVATSTLLVAYFITLVADVPLSRALLLGAVVSSTDAAALFSVMRTQGLALKGDLNALLELESGTNDPMAVFLTLTFTAWLSSPVQSPAHVIGHAVVDLVREMGLGALLGLAFGLFGVRALRSLALMTEGMYVALTTSVALIAYGLTQVLGGSGFLAVYVAGLTIGSHDPPHKRVILDLHDGLAWLVEIFMFLVLGLLSFPSQIHRIALPATVVALFLVFIARPISVFLSLALTSFDWRAKLLISWCGLRGAVPIILVTIPMVAGVPRAWDVFHGVFFAVIVSILLQGLTVPWLASRLGLRLEAENHGDSATIEAA